MQLHVRFWLLMLVVLAAGCTGGGDSGVALLGLEGQPTSAASLDQGLQTGKTFLDAWTRQDYNTMYGLISPNARDAYSEEDFTETYQQLWDNLRLQSISWQESIAQLQGTTAVLEYNMSFQSSVLGTFNDEGRIMRLIPTTEGMRIAWSRMDIFDGWAGGARLQLERFLANRGNIYDARGRVLADQNGVALPLYLTKNNIGATGSCINLLVSVLGREYQDIEATFNRYNADTLFLIGEIDPETYQLRGAEIDSTCRPQIGQRPTRRYFASAAPHIIGYVGRIPAEQSTEYDSQGYPSDALVGIDGVERSWERELRGVVGNRLSLFSTTDQRLRVITEKQATPGSSVYLTIDRDIQQGMQEAFAEAYSYAAPTWGQTSPGAAAVIMDVETGAILGMASYPSFDPAVFSPDNPYLDPASLIREYQTNLQRPLLNRATLGNYPLGSVFKLVSSVAAADSGLVPFDVLNNCTGSWDGSPYGDVTRTDWYKEGHGVLDGRGAIINSCNPYYWQMSVTLNNTDPFLISNYARMFGFGSPTGIRSIAEDGGVIPDPDFKRNQGFTWGQADASNLVIGQGEQAVTPLQVAGMVAAIANDGKLLTPYLVDRVQLIGEDPTYQAQPQSEQLPVKPEVLAEVRQAMCDVTTTPSGTANFMYEDWYRFQNYAVTVCGKTGTAQAGNAKPHAWFGAFVPADAPEIAIVVIVENSCEGSEVAAPIVRRLIEIYYGLPEYGYPDLWQSACSEIVVE